MALWPFCPTGTKCEPSDARPAGALTPNLICCSSIAEVVPRRPRLMTDTSPSTDAARSDPTKSGVGLPPQANARPQSDEQAKHTETRQYDQGRVHGRHPADVVALHNVCPHRQHQAAEASARTGR